MLRLCSILRSHLLEPFFWNSFKAVPLNLIPKSCDTADESAPSPKNFSRGSQQERVATDSYSTAALLDDQFSSVAITSLLLECVQSPDHLWDQKNAFPNVALLFKQNHMSYGTRWELMSTFKTAATCS